MSDVHDFLIDGDTYTTDGPHYSAAFSTADLNSKSISFYLFVSTLSGGGTDTMDILIEESDDQEFATAHKIRTVGSFTQVLGNSSSAAIMQQKMNPTDNSLNRWVRAKITFGSGDASVFSTKFSVYMTADEKV